MPVLCTRHPRSPDNHTLARRAEPERETRRRDGRSNRELGERTECSRGPDGASGHPGSGAQPTSGAGSTGSEADSGASKDTRRDTRVSVCVSLGACRGVSCVPVGVHPGEAQRATAAPEKRDGQWHEAAYVSGALGAGPEPAVTPAMAVTMAISEKTLLVPCFLNPRSCDTPF